MDYIHRLYMLGLIEIRLGVHKELVEWIGLCIWILVRPGTKIVIGFIDCIGTLYRLVFIEVVLGVHIEFVDCIGFDI